MQDNGVPPSGSGHQPSASAAGASSQSGVPNAWRYATLNRPDGIWRCGITDTIAAVDAALTKPLRSSRRKTEREIGQRLDAILGAIFDESRRLSPRNYNDAFACGRYLLASGMSASGQDPKGLEAKPASPTGEAGDAQGPSS